ncbi:hypothetical protein BC833DRAFT_601456 [Globomyces pollinis-pini]|nr:hypothetical protein BC833DRAFT_601456 [Globomyces pollinis-pini]
MSSDESMDSIYNQLSNSEQIINGSVNINWNDLINKPKLKKLDSIQSNKVNQKLKNHHLNCVKNPLNKQSKNDDGIRPLTFNNCHFHYDKNLDLLNSNQSKPDINPTGELPKPDIQTVNAVLEQMQRFQSGHIDEKVEKVDGIPMSLADFDPIQKSSRFNTPITTPKKFTQSVSFDDMSVKPTMNFGNSSSSYPSIDDDNKNLKTNSLLIEREKKVFQTVHQELCLLSQDLKTKHAKLVRESNELKLQKQQLDELKASLELRENQLQADVKELVANSIKQKDRQRKIDTETVINKYEDVVDHLTRENKRLQNALKEMVTANRQLRDQNKKLILENDEKEKRMEEQAVTIKLSKERVDRLKQMMKSSPPIVESKPEEPKDIFIQMKKLIQKNMDKKTFASISTQTQNISEPLELIEMDSKPNPSTSIKSPNNLINLIHYLMSHSHLIKNQSLSHNTNAFDTISSCYKILDTTCVIQKNTPLELKATLLGVFEMYLEIIHDMVESNTLTPFEQYTLAELVYNSLCAYGTEYAYLQTQRSDRSILFIYMIVLTCITQMEVVEAMLEGLMQHLTASKPCRGVLIKSNGCVRLFEILSCVPITETVSNHISSILLCLISEGKNVLSNCRIIL